ncbi:caspase domain-containing protein [Xylariaceae sp. AK1471]|nr:caspase domain-containing protein [Xylariaceae sp. AK1471]
MNKQRATSTRYAILIGINYYKNKPLKGAVRDVQDIKTHLEETLQPIHIWMFTATESTDPKLSRLWPTRRNVTSTFDEITTSAMPGDSIYIHYSGHGTREKPSVKSYNPTGDLALVLPTGDEENPETYLFGRSLAYYLNAMVMKGLVVTLVLDCCFSAGVYRSGDPSIRFLPYDLEIGSKARESLTSEVGSLGSRDVSMQPNWLVNQDQYMERYLTSFSGF